MKRTVGTCIFRLEDHIKRLFNSAKILHMQIPFTQEEICAAHRDVVRVQQPRCRLYSPSGVFGF